MDHTKLLRMIILIMGIIYIFVIPNNPMEVKLLFKIIPMLLIIYYGLQRLPIERHLTHYLILFGLGFSMIGDGTLHWFIIGLSAFLIGHLFYIGAFLRQFQWSWQRMLSIIPLLLFGLFIGYRLVESLRLDANDTLIIPVIIYILAIMTMCWLATMTNNIWAIIGSVLFVISDSILAWNKFVSVIDFADVLIMVTYYAAQFFIAHCLTTIVNTRRSI